MTEAFAIDNIPRMMTNLGYGNNYYTDYTHYILRGTESRKIEAGKHYFYLIGEAPDVSIHSDFGVYDLSDPNLEEITYIHQGSITLTNNSPNRSHILFIKVIPKN
jgi:hypothetical protein